MDELCFEQAQAQIGTNKAFANRTAQQRSASEGSNRGNMLDHECLILAWEINSKIGQSQTHLIVSGALGLGDELGIADVTIALCEQASIHDARRLHLHLGLHKHTWPTDAGVNMSNVGFMSVNLTLCVRGVWTCNCINLEVAFFWNEGFMMTGQYQICWSSLSEHHLMDGFGRGPGNSGRKHFI